MVPSVKGKKLENIRIDRIPFIEILRLRWIFCGSAVRFFPLCPMRRALCFFLPQTATEPVERRLFQIRLSAGN